MRNGLNIWYTPIHKCVSFSTWVYWHSVIGGAHSWRVFGVTLYPRWR